MITQLYPKTQERPLLGTYLAHNLRANLSDERPYIYANFVTSLDGRIAIPHPSGDGLTVPHNVANGRDWRLFQELAAQADLIISSGRYLRDWAAGRAQEILRTDEPAFADLKAWRVENGLSPQPDIAIISRSLDFPIPALLTHNNRKVVIFTSAGNDRARIEEIEAQAGQVYIVGEEKLDGLLMAKQMHRLGYRTVYSAAGPRILHLLLNADVIDRLYLTTVSRLLGGRPFSSILEGALLAQATDLQLIEQYYDSVGESSVSQLFSSYDVLARSS